MRSLNLRFVESPAATLMYFFCWLSEPVAMWRRRASDFVVASCCCTSGDFSFSSTLRSLMKIPLFSFPPLCAPPPFLL